MGNAHRAMALESTLSPPVAIACIRQAINHHDLDALAACFEPDYQSAFPAHPERAFRGHDQLHANWTQMFSTVPDLEAVLLRWAADGETVWAEWEWKGTRLDGAPFVYRGVSIQGLAQDRIRWVRMYMEPVQEGGHAIAGAVEGSMT